MKINYTPQLDIVDKHGNGFWIDLLDYPNIAVYIKPTYDCGYIYPSVSMAWNKVTKKLHRLGIGDSGRLCTEVYEDDIESKKVAEDIFNGKIKLNHINAPTKSGILEINYETNIDPIFKPVRSYDDYVIYNHPNPSEGEYVVFMNDICVAMTYLSKGIGYIITDICGDPDFDFTVAFSYGTNYSIDAINEVMRLRSIATKDMIPSKLLMEVKKLDRMGIELVYTKDWVEPIKVGIEGKPGAIYAQFIKLPIENE